MQDVIRNKEKIYGKYEDQSTAIAEIVAALDKLRRTVAINQEGLTSEESVDYIVLALKMARTVTTRGEFAVDSWVDLANYSRLVCRRRTGKDIASEFKIIADSVIPKTGLRDTSNEDEVNGHNKKTTTPVKFESWMGVKFESWIGEKCDAFLELVSGKVLLPVTAHVTEPQTEDDISTIYAIFDTHTIAANVKYVDDEFIAFGYNFQEIQARTGVKTK